MKQKIISGPKAALMIAYKAITKLGYTHKRLKEETKLTLPTLRRIRDSNLGERSPVNYYLDKFISLLEKEYKRLVNEADTAGMNAFLRIFHEILLAEHYMHHVKLD